jgi:hypothetical protein
MSIALWADRAMDVNVTCSGREWDSGMMQSLKEAGAQHCLSPDIVDSGDRTTLNFSGPLRCSKLMAFDRRWNLLNATFQGSSGFCDNLIDVGVKKIPTPERASDAGLRKSIS